MTVPVSSHLNRASEKSRTGDKLLLHCVCVDTFSCLGLFSNWSCQESPAWSTVTQWETLHGKHIPALRAPSRHSTRTSAVTRGSRSLTAPVILPPPYNLLHRRALSVWRLRPSWCCRRAYIFPLWGNSCPQVHCFFSTELHCGAPNYPELHWAWHEDFLPIMWWPEILTLSSWFVSHRYWSAKIWNSYSYIFAEHAPFM